MRLTQLRRNHESSNFGNIPISQQNYIPQNIITAQSTANPLEKIK